MSFIELDPFDNLIPSIINYIDILCGKLERKSYEFDNTLIGKDILSTLKVQYYLQILKKYGLQIILKNPNIYNSLDNIIDKKIPIELEEYYNLIRSKYPNAGMAIIFITNEICIMYNNKFEKIQILNDIGDIEIIHN